MADGNETQDTNPGTDNTEVVTENTIPATTEETSVTSPSTLPTDREVKEEGTDVSEKTEEDESNTADTVEDTSTTTTTDVNGLELDSDGYYKDTGTPEVDSVVALFREAKIDAKDAQPIFDKFIETLDFASIDKEAVVKLIGEDKADIVMTKLENYSIKEIRSREEAIKEFDKALDGKWKDVVAWSKESLKPEEASEYNELLGVGGKARELALADLKARFEGADKEGSNKLLTPTSTTNTDSDYISAKDFRIENAKLTPNNGSYPTPAQQKAIQDLLDRRGRSIAKERSQR